MIKRRLTKLKTDESTQLMRKLKSDMDEKMPDYDGFYFYNAREEMKLAQGAQSKYQDYDDERVNADADLERERQAMFRAIDGYAAARGEYEYPLMVCDTSRTRNGKEGFVLTPDHIFYHTFLKSGKINILNINKIQAANRLFSKGVYIKHFGGSKGPRLGRPHTPHRGRAQRHPQLHFQRSFLIHSAFESRGRG